MRPHSFLIPLASVHKLPGKKAFQRSSIYFTILLAILSIERLIWRSLLNAVTLSRKNGFPAQRATQRSGSISSTFIGDRSMSSPS